jgi:glycosyltransferase involved in cell wall biosynthesis
VLPGKWFWFLGGRIHFNPGAARQIRHDHPDVVVINGYSGLTNQLLMRHLRRHSIPWIFFGEVPGMNRRGLWGRVLRALARRPAVRWPDAIAAVGSQAVAAYRALAPDSCTVENIPYCCDLQLFVQAPRVAPADGSIRFLYCGQLIERKGVDLLLSAFVKLARQNSKATLTFLGEGPLRDDLATRVPPELASQIRFSGFQPIDALPKWFSEADVLVLPSRHDGWGVVVNQAIAAGLAVICSDAVGAAADLVEPDANGLIFPRGDEKALEECLRKLADHPNTVAQMGHRSWEMAGNWTPEHIAQRWYKLCSNVVARRGASRIETSND